MFGLVDFCACENHTRDPHGNIASTQPLHWHCYPNLVPRLFPSHRGKSLGMRLLLPMQKLTRKTETSVHYRPRCTTVKSTGTCPNET